MNWTGGQLRRHSGPQDTLSKYQRQNFAKSRRSVYERLSTPFHRPSQLPEISLEQEQDHGDMVVLKRRLLQTPDWASVSAAHPLDISFAQEEELEQFGKRRRLNAIDRKRLAVTHDNQPISGLFQSRQRTNFSEERIANTNHIKIRINGHLTKPHSEDSPEITTHPSSQTMLLDHEESSMPCTPRRGSDKSKTQDPWTQRTNRLSLQLNYSHAPLSLQNLLRIQAQPSAAEKPDAVAQYLSQTDCSTRLMSNSPSHNHQMKSGQFVSSALDSSSMADASQPNSWYFQIDEQNPEEQTEPDTLKSVSPDRETLLLESPTTLNFETMSYLEPTSWLPQPQQRQPLSSLHTCVQDGPRGLSSDEPIYPSPFSSLLNKTAIARPPSHAAVKIFSQILS
ncbi:hypothetical protein N7495_009303 [Penicillium taxi]|uniref:uncharacterized protein n=1 Tax=Penicillium taxi TaxID=168475 RepID=UPI00254558C1|nr:uncharacterized protein N7495_009303 [Penicillium taxi]KAJ5884793.1 hypothetical protein N7495_009303 [Penicillium taxi]